MSVNETVRQTFNSVFVVRVAFGTVLAAVVAFGVAEYVSRSANVVFSASATNLQSGMDTLTVTVNGVNDDLKAESRAFRDHRAALTEKLGALVVALEATNGELKMLAVSIGNLDRAVRDMDARLVRTDGRQRGFESFVYKVLLRDSRYDKVNPTWHKSWGIMELPDGVDVKFVYPSPEEVSALMLKYVKE